MVLLTIKRCLVPVATQVGTTMDMLLSVKVPNLALQFTAIGNDGADGLLRALISARLLFITFKSLKMGKLPYKASHNDHVSSIAFQNDALLASADCNC